jgi:hypothetical protein
MKIDGKSKEVVTYQGVFFEINIKDNQLVNLTKTWKAVGSPKNKAPWDWERGKAATQFIETVAEKLNLEKSQVFFPQRGKNGGRYAHWQIFLAYAKYLSPDFHMWANHVVKERFEEMVDPDLIGSSATNSCASGGYGGQGSIEGRIEM